MPAWEDVYPYTEQRTRARRFSLTNLLILLNLTGFVLAGFLSRNSPETLLALEFDKAQAIGSFHLWEFATYSFVQILEPKFIPWLILGIYVLYTIGNELEAEMGALRYLGVYFGCAFYGALAHAMLQYLVPAAWPGARIGPAATLCAPVLGVVTTAAWRWPRRTILLGFFLPLRLPTALAALGIAWLAFAAWIDLGVGTSIGAVITALAIALVEPQVNRSFERAALRRERDQFLEEVDVRRRTDAILEKISREGIDRLSRSEFQTLRQASQILNRTKSPPHE